MEQYTNTNIQLIIRSGGASLVTGLLYMINHGNMALAMILMTIIWITLMYLQFGSDFSNQLETQTN